MDSKTLLILTIFAFLCASSYSSNSLTTRAQNGNGLLKRESYEHKLMTRAEAAAKEVSPLETVSRSYGHHHHHGYYKHYRERAVSDATAKASGTKAAGGKGTAADKTKAAVVSRKHGHGHHKMRNSYHHGHHKHHRARTLVPEKNQQTKVPSTTSKTMDDKKILARAAPEILPGKVADNKTSAATAPEGGKTSNVPSNGSSPVQGGIKLREAESHYKPEHYAHHGYGYRSGYY